MAWSITFYLMAGLFLGLTLYHRFILPHPASDVKRPGLTPGKLLEDFFKTFVTFFEKKNLGLMFFFLLTYEIHKIHNTFDVIIYNQQLFVL